MKLNLGAIASPSVQDVFVQMPISGFEGLLLDVLVAKNDNNIMLSHVHKILSMIVSFGTKSCCKV